MPSRFARWSFFGLLWIALGVILTAEVFFNMRAMKADVRLFDVAVWQFTRVTIWGLLTPLILWLRESVRISGRNWFGGVSFHLAMSFVVMAAYYLARVCYQMVIWGEPLKQLWPVVKDNFHGRNLIDMGFYWVVMGFGYSFELYRRYKNEQIRTAQLESRLNETELKALKHQLHPHFLFNTMNTIAVLVREQRNEEAVSLLSKLSALLRYSLDAGRDQEVTLRQELEFLERYIEIQKKRFADRLTVRIAINPDVLEVKIPSLLLQPLVENAILHGVAGKREPGTIEVLGEAEGDSLHLQVRDDGVGFRTQSGEAPREGIGLRNTRERLAKLYGHRGGLVVRTEPGHGTTVSIVLPLHGSLVRTR